MSRVCWILTLAIAVNVLTLGTLYLWDRQRFFGWLVTFPPDPIHILHFNDQYDIMKSPKWVERVMGCRQRDTITVFSGDIMSPSILAETMRGKQFVKMLKMIELDYAVPGNHEADLGVMDFHSFRNEYPRAQWLVANLHHKGSFEETGNEANSIPDGTPYGGHKSSPSGTTGASGSGSSDWSTGSGWPICPGSRWTGLRTLTSWRRGGGCRSCCGRKGATWSSQSPTCRSHTTGS